MSLYLSITTSSDTMSNRISTKVKHEMVDKYTLSEAIHNSESIAFERIIKCDQRNDPLA